MDVILAVLAMVVGGLCTFGGAYWGCTLSDRAARKLRDQETEARRAAQLQTLKRQICLGHQFSFSESGEFRNAMLLHVSALGPLLLDGQTLTYPRDDQLLSKGSEKLRRNQATSRPGKTAKLLRHPT